MKPLTIGVIAILALAAGTIAVAAEPILGTWKLNKAKSVPGSGSLPQSYTCTYSDAGGGAIKFAAHVVTSEGEKRETSWVSKRDGTEVPYTGSPRYDTIINQPAVKGVSGSWVVKKAGKEVGGGKWSLSADGKVLTWNMHGTSAEGKPTTSKYVLDRQ